jgi:hypothetical protein
MVRCNMNIYIVCAVAWHKLAKSPPPPSRYINSKYYLGTYMPIHTQFWKQAWSAFSGEVSLYKGKSENKVPYFIATK